MDVRLPNGVILRNVPEGTDKYTIMEKAINAGLATDADFGQGDNYVGGRRNDRSPVPESFIGRAGAGYGKSVADLGRGAMQVAGMINPVVGATSGLALRGSMLDPSGEAVTESRRLDAPLMATGGGKTGYIGGMVANTLPAAGIPGANTLLGAGAIGAGIGALQPAASGGERAANTAIGGAIGPVGVLAGRGLSSAWNAGKALVEPMTRGGQQRIAARALTAFAGGADEAGRAAQNIDDALRQPTLSGVRPTTAELAQNPGIAQLERTIRNNPEYLTALSNRLQVNKEAILSALDDIAGDSGRMAAATGARQSATSALYGAADQVMVRPDQELMSLLQRPSMTKAWQVAVDLASEAGEELPQQLDELSGRTLHYLKMAMDDLADNPASHGIGGNQVRAITSTKNQLVQWIGRNIPDYDAARTTYASMSQPINQMEIGQTLRNRFQPALADFGATGRGRAQAFAQALREGDATAANALGRSRASMSDIMGPEQMSRLRMIAEQLGRRANADDLGRAVGSNTGQNLISQNVVRQFLGPLGLPESTIERAAGSTLMQSVMRPVQWLGDIGEKRAMDILAEAALDPTVAQEMLRIGIDPQKINMLLRNQQYIAPSLVSGANALRE